MDHAAEAAAYELLERLRWGEAPEHCPHCGSIGDCYFLRPAEGLVRRTRTGALTARRVWKCGGCRRQFTVLTGTVLQGTRIPLATWVAGARGTADVTARMHAVFDAAGSDVRREGDELLAAVLAIDAKKAAEIRVAARRHRPRPQSGPTADYGLG